MNKSGFDLASVLLVAGFIGLFIYQDLFKTKTLGNPGNNYGIKDMSWNGGKKYYEYSAINNNTNYSKIPANVKTYVQPINLNNNISQKLVGGLINDILV